MASLLNFQPSILGLAISCPISNSLGDVNLRDFRSDIITQET